MRFSAFFAALALALVISAPAGAASYPDKQITNIIAFTAGGSSDVQARIMQKYWNKYAKDAPWVFVYKPGAGGMIGFTEIAKSKADGYTIGGMNTPHLILQSLAQNAQFKPNDFEYICEVVNDPQCVAVRKDSPFKTIEELVAFAEKNPGKLKVGLSGPLSGHHLMLLDWQKKMPNAKLSNVFYKGAADQNAALLGGEVDLMFGNINDVMRALDEFRVLGVAADKRNDFLPEIPTLKERKIDIVSDIRRAFAAPKGIAPEKIKALRDIFEKISKDPEYIADMKKAGQPYEYMSGPDFAKYIDSQTDKARKALSEAGLLKQK